MITIRRSSFPRSGRSSRSAKPAGWAWVRRGGFEIGGRREVLSGEGIMGRGREGRGRWRVEGWEGERGGEDGGKGG